MVDVLDCYILCFFMLVFRFSMVVLGVSGVEDMFMSFKFVIRLFLILFVWSLLVENLND